MNRNLYKVYLTLILSMFSLSTMAAGVMNMSEGAARTLSTESDISTVFVSNPKVADYQVISKNKVVVYAREAGHSSVIVFDKDGKTLASRKVVVNKSLSRIQQYIAVNFPDTNVDVFNVGEQVVLSGTVSNEQQKDEINDIVGQLLAKKYEKGVFEVDVGDKDIEMKYMERRFYKHIVNNIQVAVTKQVNVKLSIAEVTQTFLKEIGVEYGTDTAGVFVNPINDFRASNILTVINAVDDDSIGQILAEPNLSVISGESASFLVGGEIPVVTTVDDGTNVIYKDYGIQLELMAKVERDDKITLSMIPSVSSIDQVYSNDNYNLPSLKTRRARTTVQLGDGQSFVLGGLLSTEDIESLTKLPFIGDIPILGALFRNSATNRKKTELVIVATVNLVKPVHPSQVQLPMMRRTTTLDRFFGFTDDNKYPKASEKWSKELLATGGFKK
ncbi:type II and III secretion system protein family protein [Vibrio marisflavi]|uniref:Type 3 secretion system secretin n=1 Tax=Vibrio marisflavi CECT 7928 TaxID=634439 RepID=A0ABN8E4C8_9VIBR|nr:pilus assembly protein N-terminal domain-containing protein [Vibrio marisflavi]CAH0540336.1 Type 3 secretion system secretin [Vibrio marisflavi CECT 7928]